MDDIKISIESNKKTPKEELLPLISKQFNISIQSQKKLWWNYWFN